MNKTVVGLATLETLEPKTARADWLHNLDLDAPPKGNGVLISLSDDNGQTLAAVITGKGEDIGDRTGGGGLYVRKPDSTQSWLARSTLRAQRRRGRLVRQEPDRRGPRAHRGNGRHAAWRPGLHRQTRETGRPGTSSW